MNRIIRIPGVALLSLMLLPGAGWTGAKTLDDPFVFFRPAVVITPDERRIIDTGQVVVRVLPAPEEEVAVLAAVRLEAGGETLVAGVRHIAELKKGPFVLAIRRFSDPPNLRDLDGLALDREDLEAIRECRPSQCKIKLSRQELERLRRVAADSGAQWKSALQEAFQGLVLERVRAYRARGHRGISEYNDHATPVSLQAKFSSLIRGSPFLLAHMPRLAAYLEDYPRTLPGVESFLYWSKETFGRKAVISVTHVCIVRTDGHGGLPEALVAGKQVFATHYMNGALALTAVIPGRPGSHNYLVYLNRSQVDALGGFLGWLKRAVVHQRLKGETDKIFRALRERLERLERSRSTSPAPHPSPCGNGHESQ